MLTPDGENSSGPAGLLTGQVSKDRRTVCKLWPADFDPDQGGEMYDEDEFGDSTLCYCTATEAWNPKTKLQQITSNSFANS